MGRNTIDNLVLVLAERQKNLFKLAEKEPRTVQYNQINDQIEFIEDLFRLAGDTRPLDVQLDTNFAKAIR